MPEDDERDVRRPKRPPARVAEQIAREDAAPRGPLLSEESMPVARTPDEAIGQIALRVRTISKELHANTVATATISTRVDSVQSQVNTLSVEQRTTGEKVDDLRAKMGEVGGKLETLTGLLKDELESRREPQKLRMTAEVDLAKAKGHAQIQEAQASGAHKRELTMKVIAAILIPLATALITYFLTRE